jgi:hypothetical protein
LPHICLLIPVPEIHVIETKQDSCDSRYFGIKVGVDFTDIRVVDTVPYNTYGTISYGNGGGYNGLGNYLDDFSGASATVAQTFGSPIVHANIPRAPATHVT